MSDVAVLNATGELLGLVTLRHAVGMLIRQVAVVEEHLEGRTVGPYPWPRVLRLVRAITTAWRTRGEPSWMKAGVHARDRCCAYCGGPAESVDHLTPKSRGVCPPG